MKKVLIFSLIFLFFTKPVNAASDLNVVFEGTPMFNLTNLSPGDPPITKTIKIKNTSSLAKTPILKAVKTSGNGLETGLNVAIENIWVGKLAELFGKNISLGSISPSSEKTFSLIADLPKSAGNEFQNKNVVFNIDIGTDSIGHLLITEASYSSFIKHRNSNRERYCRYIFFRPLRDLFDCDDRRFDGQWIEIYNPTDNEQTLKNWRLENRNSSIDIRPNQSIKPKSFLLIAKNHSDLNPHDLRRNTKIINVDHWFKSGLNQKNDRVILKDNKNEEVDQVSWGNEFPPAANNQSTQRKILTVDTDTFADWINSTPTPGY